MTEPLSRVELIELVEKIMHGEGTEEETNEWLELIKANVPDPEVSDLIFWPDVRGLPDNLTAEQIVDMAVSYKPIALPASATSQHHIDQEEESAT